MIWAETKEKVFYGAGSLETRRGSFNPSDSHLDTSLKPVTLKNKDKLNDSQDHTNHKIKQQFVPFLENIFCFWSKIKQIL